MTSIANRCEYCGKTFYRNTSHASAQRFCSTACWYQWKREEREPKLCEMCGEPLQNGDRFCSHACYARWRSAHLTGADNPNWRGGADHVCAECGKPFTTRPCHRDRARYCSGACQRRAYRKTHVTKNCEWCGKAYTTIRSRAQRSRFCSLDCRNAAWVEGNRGENHPLWKGGKVGYRGPNWYRQARKARERDNHTCQRCGITQELYGKRLTVHHIVPFRKFGLERYKEANDLANLVTLCASCHQTVEWALILTSGTGQESPEHLLECLPVH